jgi:tight adherence protein B
MTKTVLIVIALLAIAMMAIGIVSLMRGGDNDRKRLKRRLAAVAGGRKPVAQVQGLALSKAEPESGFIRTLVARVLALVGYDPAVPNRPLPNWAALLIALVVARGLTWLVTSLCGPLGWFAFPFALLIVLRQYYIWCTTRWRMALFKQFPDALSTIVRAVRVGVSLAEGIRQVSQEAPEPTAAIFGEIASALAIGTTLVDAMSASTAKTGLPEYRFFTTALVLQARTGGGLAATLDGLADVIRKRVMVRARGKALAAEARASAAVLALLPVATVGGMMVLNPDYMTSLFTNPTGHKILAMAALSEGVGIFAMRTMIVRSLS